MRDRRRTYTGILLVSFCFLMYLIGVIQHAQEYFTYTMALILMMGGNRASISNQLYLFIWPICALRHSQERFTYTTGNPKTSYNRCEAYMSRPVTTEQLVNDRK